MKQKILSTNKYFFDTDCLSTFLRIDKEDILFEMFDYIYIPQQVYKELGRYIRNNKNILKVKVDNLVKQKKVKIFDIDLETQEYIMFLDMTRHTEMNIPIIGYGEAASIVLALQYNGIIASNNMKDINFYIKKYQLQYITTADILVEAYNRRIMSWMEIEAIWNSISAFSNLPFKTFVEYMQSKDDNDV